MDFYYVLELREETPRWWKRRWADFAFALLINFLHMVRGLVEVLTAEVTEIEEHELAHCQKYSFCAETSSPDEPTELITCVKRDALNK